MDAETLTIKAVEDVLRLPTYHETPADAEGDYVTVTLDGGGAAQSYLSSPSLTIAIHSNTWSHCRAYMNRLTKLLIQRLMYDPYVFGASIDTTYRRDDPTTNQPRAIVGLNLDLNSNK